MSDLFFQWSDPADTWANPDDTWASLASPPPPPTPQSTAYKPITTLVTRPVTARFLAALSSTNQTRVVRVDVWNGNTLIQTLTSVDDGSVTVDKTATIRRTLSLTIIDKGLTMVGEGGVQVDNPDSVVPNAPSDLLHPLSGNEIRPYRGFQYANGDQELCALGVFRLTQPQITDTGDAVTLTINGNDRSSAISLAKWTAPYQILAGADLATTVIGILNSRWHGPVALDMSLITPTSGNADASQNFSLPLTTLGTDLAGSNDPWADLQSLVTPCGMELFFNTSGQPVMQPIVNPVSGTAGVSFLGAYEDDSGIGTLVMAERVLDETGTFSGVIGIGNGTGTDEFGNAIPPVTSISVSPTDGNLYNGVWNTNPDSPTYFDPGNPEASAFGEVPYIFETQAIPGDGDSPQSAQLKINAAALAQLQLILTAYEDPDFTCVTNAALWEDDIIKLGRARAGIDAQYIVQGMTIPLDVVTAMAVTLQPQLQPAA